MRSNHLVKEPIIPCNPPKYFCHRAIGKPGKLDGDINKPFWQTGEWIDDFHDIEGDTLPRPAKRTKVKLLWDEEALYIGGIHIPPAYRYMPSILRGLLAGALADEQGSYEKVIWHVNKKNEESQKNFLRFGRIVGDTGLSYCVEMTQEGMEKIKRLGQRS